MKKFVSVLLCLVMAMSLCTVAFADDCDHRDNHWRYDSNGNGTHKLICLDCNKVVDDSDAIPCYYGENDEKDACTMCGGKKPVACETHTFVDGVCSVCGYECNHMANKWVYKSNGNGTHDVICEVCGKHESKNMACTYEDGKCITCKDTCDHMANKWVYKSNGDGTHDVICEVCGKHVSPNMACTYENGKCITCGAVKPVCDHVGVQKVVDNKDGKTHTVICPKCNKVLYTDVAHVYAKDGKCACGAVKPAECKHEGAQKLVPNKDEKTHNAYCPECGELMSEKIPHTYQYNEKGEFVGKGGAYCLCGAKKSTSSSGSHTGSHTGSNTTTSTTTKSPKTGDMGVVLYAATALLSLSGTAVVIKKRKNDK